MKLFGLPAEVEDRLQKLNQSMDMIDLIRFRDEFAMRLMPVLLAGNLTTVVQAEDICTKAYAIVEEMLKARLK